MTRNIVNDERNQIMKTLKHLEMLYFVHCAEVYKDTDNTYGFRL